MRVTKPYSKITKTNNKSLPDRSNIKLELENKTTSKRYKKPRQTKKKVF